MRGTQHAATGACAQKEGRGARSSQREHILTEKLLDLPDVSIKASIMHNTDYYKHGTSSWLYGSSTPSKKLLGHMFIIAAGDFLPKSVTPLPSFPRACDKHDAADAWRCGVRWMQDAVRYDALCPC